MPLPCRTVLHGSWRWSDGPPVRPLPSFCPTTGPWPPACATGRMVPRRGLPLAHLAHLPLFEFFTSATNSNLARDRFACPRPRPAAWKYLSTYGNVASREPRSPLLVRPGHHVPTRDPPWRVALAHVRPRGNRAKGLSLGSRRAALAARGPTWTTPADPWEGSPSFPRKTRVQAARRGKEVKEVGKKFGGQSPVE